MDMKMEKILRKIIQKIIKNCTVYCVPRGRGTPRSENFKNQGVGGGNGEEKNWNFD